MYVVKSVENNVIVLEKNDVGKILKNYSENDEVFLDFDSKEFFNIFIGSFRFIYFVINYRIKILYKIINI